MTERQAPPEGWIWIDEASDMPEQLWSDLWKGGPRPARDRFPFRNHRTVAEVWGLATGGNAS